MPDILEKLAGEVGWVRSSEGVFRPGDGKATVKPDTDTCPVCGNDVLTTELECTGCDTARVDPAWADDPED